jgi:hypothetical protein
MNRRNFFKSLAALPVAAALPSETWSLDDMFGPPLPYLDHVAVGRAYAAALAASMLQTKEMLCANILNNAFNPPDKWIGPPHPSWDHELA